MAPLDEANELLRRASTRIAVVGASNDPRKYGNIITKDMLRHGYQVFPVNPNEKTIAGLAVYPTLKDVPKPIDIVDVVTPPDVTLRILKDAEAAGCRLVWLQPGSFDDAVLAAGSRTALSIVDDACILVEARRVSKTRS
jgi:predicted CoA-binding protein